MEGLRMELRKAEEEKRRICGERDQALEDLRNVETAFSDLHRKYERAKETLENLKKNEELLISRDEIMSKKLADKAAHIQVLKKEMQETLERMYGEYERKGEEGEAETSRLRVMIRKGEMKISTISSDLEQKTKENAQLHALCDELIQNNQRTSSSCGDR